jgi:hypothetical protein
MRTVLAFLLSLVFSLNTAYAGVAGVCDAVDHLPKNEAGQHFHIDHHSHDPSESDAVTASHDDGGPQQAAGPTGDHCHAHGTSGSAALGVDMTVPLLSGAYVFVASPSALLVSIAPACLERPPRVSRA